MKNILITILAVCTWLQAQAQDVKLSYQYVQGTKDTVLVFGQSTTVNPVQINSLTSSLLYDQGATFEGYQSSLATNWGNTAENQLSEQSISKSYNGQAFQKQWSYGIAALGQNSITLPGNNAAGVLLFKAWFSNVNGTNFYLENLAESVNMNNITTSTSVNDVVYFVQAPGNQLPVEFLSFEAVAKENAIQLNWITANESNNQGFEVERSSNLQSFQSIGWVEGAGNQIGEMSYSFSDNTLTPNQRYYYRLRQVDVNGNFNYSEILEASLSGGSLVVSACFPNPATQQTAVKLTSTEAQRVSWTLYNTLGKVMNRGNVNMLANESQQVNIPLTSLSKGNYLLHIQHKSYLESKKLTVY